VNVPIDGDLARYGTFYAGKVLLGLVGVPEVALAADFVGVLFQHVQERDPRSRPPCELDGGRQHGLRLGRAVEWEE
jgi:hypothetical protein